MEVVVVMTYVVGVKVKGGPVFIMVVVMPWEHAVDNLLNDVMRAHAVHDDLSFVMPVMPMLFVIFTGAGRARGGRRRRRPAYFIVLLMLCYVDIEIFMPVSVVIIHF